jgi:hypothetical protein
MFTASDDAARRRVAVVGADVPAMLDADEQSMLGRTLLIRAVPFEVIGVFERKGAVGMSNPDDDVWVPLQTARYRLTGTDALQSITVEVSPQSTIEQAMVDIERVLRRAHGILPGRDNDFAIFDRKTFFNARAQAAEIFSFLLAGIAGVSLIVGGIGIMNIMLVTVAGRHARVDHAAVPGRVGDAVRAGRAARNPARIRAVDAAREVRRLADLRDGRQRAAVLLFRGDGRARLRDDAGPARRTTGPDRGPALRVTRRALAAGGDPT